MADTPSNDIEQRLRKYAQQRRDALGTPELHPATRALLQAEVKQHHRASAPGPSPRTGWVRLWPRLAFALGAIVVLGVASLLLLPPGGPTKATLEMAKFDGSAPVLNQPVESRIAPAAAPATTAAPVTEMSGIIFQRATIAESPPQSARREPTQALGDGWARRDIDKSSTDTVGFADSLTTVQGEKAMALAGSDRTTRSTVSPAAKPANLAPAKEPSLNFASDKDLKSDAPISGEKKAEANTFYYHQATATQNLLTANATPSGQRFRNLVSNPKTKQKSTAVLDEFTIAQEGETLMVIDHDGSVYNGYARLVPAESPAYNNSPGERANPVQLVPNSNGGGRARAALEQRAFNNASAGNPPEVAQRFAPGLASQTQNAAAPVNLFFRVEGTNRSLNQRVIFTGNLLPNSSASTLQTPQSTTQKSQLPAAPIGNNALNFNHVINGQVQLGDQPAGELNALSVEP